MLRMNLGLLAVALAPLGAGCVLGPPADDPPGDDPPGNTAFRFEPVAVSGVTPRWGASVAAGHLLGGVDYGMNVSKEVVSLAVGEGGLSGSAVGELDVPRFCACSLFDEGRRELVMLGGRDDFYRDVNSAVLLNVDTGERTALDQGEAADHPIGCMAFF